MHGFVSQKKNLTQTSTNTTKEFTFNSKNVLEMFKLAAPNQLLLLQTTSGAPYLAIPIGNDI